jgi:hypothetical protein
VKTGRKYKVPSLTFFAMQRHALFRCSKQKQRRHQRQDLVQTHELAPPLGDGWLPCERELTCAQSRSAIKDGGQQRVDSGAPRQNRQTDVRPVLQVKTKTRGTGYLPQTPKRQLRSWPEEERQLPVTPILQLRPTDFAYGTSFAEWMQLVSPNLSVRSSGGSEDGWAVPASWYDHATRGFGQTPILPSTPSKQGCLTTAATANDALVCQWSASPLPTKFTYMSPCHTNGSTQSPLPTCVPPEHTLLSPISFSTFTASSKDDDAAFEHAWRKWEASLGENANELPLPAVNEYETIGLRCSKKRRRDYDDFEFDVDDALMGPGLLDESANIFKGVDEQGYSTISDPSLVAGSLFAVYE